MRLLLFLFLTFPFSSWAGIYIEPYLGVSSATGSSTYESVGKFDHAYSGQSYGARIGYYGTSYFSGVDYSVTNTSISTENNGVSADDDISITGLNLIIGKLLNNWKIWFGVILTSDIKDLDSSHGSDNFIANNETFESGGGFLAGFSYYLTQHVQLNFEYRFWDYESSYIAGEYVSNFDMLELTETAFFISFPFGL
jgi:hypothetical protein